jgi:phage baseplate assembly protein W
VPQIKDVVYSDLDISFVAHPETGELNRLTNANAVTQALKTLVLTNYFERFQQPFLASNVRAQLFEPFDSITASYIRDEIVRVVSNDPRASLLSCTVTPELSSDGYNVVITYSVTSQTEPITITFFLERLR